MTRDFLLLRNKNINRSRSNLPSQKLLIINALNNLYYLRFIDWMRVVCLQINSRAADTMNEKFE